VLKPAKPPTDVASYRPISLLPIISKILETLLLNKLTEETHLRTLVQDWVPEHQFGFRKAHSTIQQCHRLSDNINRALEEQEFCTAVFLDISQAFDKVWHSDLLFKIDQTLPPRFYNILKSYLQQLQLVVTYNNATSLPVQMLSGVPQGSVLGPFLYTLFTADVPQHNSTTISTFADDTAVLSRHTNLTTAIANLQTHLDSIEEWTQKWRLKINKNKSTHVTFTLRKGNTPHLYFNNNNIPQAETVKYLGLHFDKRLNWKQHIIKTRKHLNLKASQQYWILGRHSPLSLLNKTLIYKVILKPVWIYGIELWGCASSSNVEIIQRYQSKMLRLIAQAPWYEYVTNQTLHRDLCIATVRETFKDKAEAHHKTLSSHPNSLMRPLTTQPSTRRLRRKWTFDGIK